MLRLVSNARQETIQKYARSSIKQFKFSWLAARHAAAFEFFSAIEQGTRHTTGTSYGHGVPVGAELQSNGTTEVAIWLMFQ